MITVDVKEKSFGATPILKDVSFDWKKAYDARVDLEAKDSCVGSMKLLRRGIMGGPSSGMNYMGLLKHIETLKESGKIEHLKNKDGSLSAVFICCDSPLQHINDYFEVLDEDNFPSIYEVEEGDW